VVSESVERVYCTPFASVVKPFVHMTAVDDEEAEEADENMLVLDGAPPVVEVPVTSTPAHCPGLPAVAV